MSHIELIIERQEGEKLLTTLDIRWESHKVQFHKEDQWEVVFRTPNNLFKPEKRCPGFISTFTDDMLIVIERTHVLL
jgi:hypothetical protein